MTTALGRLWMFDARQAVHLPSRYTLNLANSGHFLRGTANLHMVHDVHPYVGYAVPDGRVNVRGVRARGRNHRRPDHGRSEHISGGDSPPLPVTDRAVGHRPLAACLRPGCTRSTSDQCTGRCTRQADSSVTGCDVSILDNHQSVTWDRAAPIASSLSHVVASRVTGGVAGRASFAGRHLSRARTPGACCRATGGWGVNPYPARPLLAGSQSTQPVPQ